MDMDTALGDAVRRAEETSARGGRSEVRISGPEHDNVLAYQSAERSLLSRAVGDNNAGG